MKRKSLSTSSSDWQGFARTLLLTVAVSLLLTYVSVYVIDPYDLFLHSPQVQRLPVSKMPRHWKPGLARKERFDSLILGTSAVMLLKPARLNPLLDAKIANLAIPAATQYEQLRMAALFQHYHNTLNLVIVGIDQAWCNIHGSPRYARLGDGRLEERRPIEEWRYATNFWSQLPPLNSRIVKDSRKQLKSMLGLENYGIDQDGYFDFTVEYEEDFSAAVLRKKLYPPNLPAPDETSRVAPATVALWPFPDIQQLGDWAHALPSTTRKIFVFPPYHHNHQSLRGYKNAARWQECKRRVAQIAETVTDTTVIDFMYDSPVTLNDNNYWDPIHYNVAVAKKIEASLAQVTSQTPGVTDSERENTDAIYRVLSKP